MAKTWFRQAVQCQLLQVQFVQEATVQKKLPGCFVFCFLNLNPVSDQESFLVGVFFLRVHRLKYALPRACSIFSSLVFLVLLWLAVWFLSRFISLCVSLLILTKWGGGSSGYPPHRTVEAITELMPVTRSYSLLVGCLDFTYLCSLCCYFLCFMTLSHLGPGQTALPRAR